jgi:hypothetical protein
MPIKPARSDSERAGEEGNARQEPELPGEEGEHDDGVGREHLVLTDQEGHGALADVPRDARHGFVAFRGRLHLQVEDEGHDKGYGARAERLQV